MEQGIFDFSEAWSSGKAYTKPRRNKGHFFFRFFTLFSFLDTLNKLSELSGITFSNVRKIVSYDLFEMCLLLCPVVPLKMSQTSYGSPIRFTYKTLDAQTNVYSRFRKRLQDILGKLVIAAQLYAQISFYSRSKDLFSVLVLTNKLSLDFIKKKYTERFNV